jgi:hypothetical protein
MGRKDFDGWEQALESRLTGRFPWGSIALDKKIRVFVRASLPGTLRIAEVNLHIRSYRKFLVFRHL